MFKQLPIYFMIILLMSGCSTLATTSSTPNSTLSATSSPTKAPLPSPTQISSSGIEGHVTEGPMCPGPVPVNGSTECADRPYQATLSILDANNLVISTFQTDMTGYFKVSLDPGMYTIHPKSENKLPHAADQAVIVKEGEYTQVIVMFDTGMR